MPVGDAVMTAHSHLLTAKRGIKAYTYALMFCPSPCFVAEDTYICADITFVKLVS